MKNLFLIFGLLLFTNSGRIFWFPNFTETKISSTAYTEGSLIVMKDGVRLMTFEACSVTGYLQIEDPSGVATNYITITGGGK